MQENNALFRGNENTLQASENYHEYSQPEHNDGLALEDLMEAKRKRK
jgi:hypothetical protein